MKINFIPAMITYKLICCSVSNKFPEKETKYNFFQLLTYTTIYQELEDSVYIFCKQNMKLFHNIYLFKCINFNQFPTLAS